MMTELIQNIVATAGAVIVAFGGIGVIVAGIVKFSANRLADSISAKYELKLNKELEDYKNFIFKENEKLKLRFEKLNYVSKARFDEEMRAYKELSVAFLNLNKGICSIIPPGLVMVPKDKCAQEERKKRNYNLAGASLAAAYDALYSNALFIKKNYLDSYAELLRQGEIQMWKFQDSIDNPELFSLRGDDYMKSKELSDSLHQLNDEIREYLATLEIDDGRIS